MPETKSIFQITQPTGGFGGMVTKPWSERNKTTQQLLTQSSQSLSQIAGIRVIPLTRSQDAVPTPCVVVVPLDWGDFKGISKYGLRFEDKAGTLRLIEQMPCSLDRGQVGVPRVSVEVRRK